MPDPVVFLHRSTRHTLPWGDTYAVRRSGGFRDTSKEELSRIVADVEAGQPWQQRVDAAFATTSPWLHKVIRSPLRTAFFGSVLPEGDGPVLDIGAGWGQIARPLAATRPVIALEPVEERLAFIRAAAKQDGVAANLAFLEVDYFDAAFQTRLEAICAIGVFEWAGAFQSEEDPQERQKRFLQKAHGELKPGGALVIGIENRLGLKYLLGCPDDHIGVPAIACLPAPLARARCHAVRGHPLQSFTYSHAELRELLLAVGFRTVEFFGAFPDYKLPEQIVAFGSDGETLNGWLAGHDAPAEHNGYDGTPLSPEMQEALHAHYRSLATDGAAHVFVPSFFVRATA